MKTTLKKRLFTAAFVIAFLLWMLINELYVNNLIKNGPTKRVYMEITKKERFHKSNRVYGFIDDDFTCFYVTSYFYKTVFPGDSVEIIISQRNRHVQRINEKKIIRVQK